MSEPRSELDTPYELACEIRRVLDDAPRQVLDTVRAEATVVGRRLGRQRGTASLNSQRESTALQSGSGEAPDPLRAPRWQTDGPENDVAWILALADLHLLSALCGDDAPQLRPPLLPLPVAVELCGMLLAEDAAGRDPVKCHAIDERWRRVKARWKLDAPGEGGVCDGVGSAHPVAAADGPANAEATATTKGGTEVDGPNIPPRARTAHAQYRQAADALGENDPTDREAYDALTRAYATAGEANDLPTFATWQRNLREYRRLSGSQKSTSRTGRAEATQRFAKVEDIEPQSLPNQVRPRWADK